MEGSTIRIGDYLDIKGGKRGTCKECKTEVYWTATNLASHKRRNCTIPEEQKSLWPDPYDSVITSRNINEYLENKDPETRRGTCKVCGMQVFWSNTHLANHKRSKCNIPEEEIAEWEIHIFDDTVKRQKKKLLNISNYLENRNTSKRRGNCIVCGVEVYWSVQGLLNHKRKKCVESEIASDIWLNFDKNTSESVVEPISKPSKETALPVLTASEQSTGEISLSSTDIISEYLQDKNSLTRRGTCRVCFSSVFWTISHLILHKLRKCPITESEKESWISLKEKLNEAKEAKSQDAEINIGDYLTDKNILTRRGTCKVCQKRVYWATLHLTSHKKSKCRISEEEKTFWSTLKKGNNVHTYVVQKEAEPNDNNQTVELMDDCQIPEENTNIDNDVSTFDEHESKDLESQHNNKEFKSKQFLPNHENVQTLDPLVCDYCEKTFSTRHHLKVHIFSHIKETTKKSYRDLEEPSNIGVLLEMFDGNQVVSNKDFVFEQVLIKQEQQCETQADNMYAEISYEDTQDTNNQFECCRKQFSTFSGLARHQYTYHVEIFHMMVESMRNEISNLMALGNVPPVRQEKSKVAKNESTKSELFEDNDEYNPELSEDFISPNVNVECFICEQELRALSYDKHLSTVHPLEDATKAKQATTKFFCNCCSETFGTISLCISHLKKAWHQYSGTECNICLQSGFRNLRDLNEHRKMTHKNNVITCETCQKTFKYAQTLKLHKLKHLGLKPAYCSSCGYKTVNQEQMDRHMTKHENEPKSVCPHCGRTFSGVLKLRRHIFDSHKSQQKTPEEKLKPINCKHCGLTCLGKDRLQGHISRAHRERNYKCDDCDKFFISQRLLDHHRIVHTQEIHFFCDLCGKGFTRNNTLRKHMQTHDDSTLNFICDLCQKAFRAKRDLDRHIKVHTGQKDYKCSKCAAVFFDRNGLQKHMVKLHGHGLPNYKNTKINVAYKQNLI